MRRCDFAREKDRFVNLATPTSIRAQVSLYRTASIMAIAASELVRIFNCSLAIYAVCCRSLSSTLFSHLSSLSTLFLSPVAALAIYGDTSKISLIKEMCFKYRLYKTFFFFFLLYLIFIFFKNNLSIWFHNSFISLKFFQK